jgi:hypothetical protein
MRDEETLDENYIASSLLERESGDAVAELTGNRGERYE